MQSILVDYSEDALLTRGDKDGIDRFGIRSAYGTPKHSTLSEYLAALGAAAFWSKKRFACIRNPWDRAISFYFSPHRGRSVWNRDEFIRVLDEIHPLVAYLRLPDDPPGSNPDKNLDCLIRFERLQQDFDQVCNLLGIAGQPLPLRNRSDRLAYPNYYDDELIRIVAKRFSEDVSLFGYAFDAVAGAGE